MAASLWADYHHTGRTNVALPIPLDLEPVLRWGQSTIHQRLNGLLVNWYDGKLGHYIGPHHDSTTNIVGGVPIFTISLGEERVFRLTNPKSKETRDFVARDGTVFITPYDTNLAWKHAVPWVARYQWVSPRLLQKYALRLRGLPLVLPVKQVGFHSKPDFQLLV